MTQWLLIDDAPASGARNMAVDEFLLRRVENDGGAPVLRLYSFSPPAITLGYHQDASKAIDISAVGADGLDIVRRITGGRALLHDGELTYSVTAPIGPPFGQGLADTFLVIAGVIVSALRRSGIEARLGSARHTGVEKLDVIALPRIDEQARDNGRGKEDIGKRAEKDRRSVHPAWIDTHADRLREDRAVPSRGMEGARGDDHDCRGGDGRCWKGQESSAATS